MSSLARGCRPASSIFYYFFTKFTTFWRKTHNRTKPNTKKIKIKNVKSRASSANCRYGRRKSLQSVPNCRKLLLSVRCHITYIFRCFVAFPTQTPCLHSVPRKFIYYFQLICLVRRYCFSVYHPNPPPTTHAVTFCYSFVALWHWGVNLLIALFHISINSLLIQLKLHFNITTGIYLSFTV